MWQILRNIITLAISGKRNTGKEDQMVIIKAILSTIDALYILAMIDLYKFDSNRELAGLVIPVVLLLANIFLMWR